MRELTIGAIVTGIMFWAVWSTTVLPMMQQFVRAIP